MSAELLARLQFGFTVTFHIIFPTTSIGLAAFLVVIEGMWLRTRDPLYLSIYKFWLTIFAMGFGIGVVTGIVLSFEFGLGFSRFSQIAGPVIGPMIALEVLTSFFLEAGFLGVMLFGMGRVGPRVHYAATCLVALGTLLSASWILSTNSWMQTPTGVAWQHGRLVVTDWWQAVFNPSWRYRLPRMVTAAWLTGCFFVSGVSAWYLQRQRHLAMAKRTLSLALGFATLLIGGQVFLGDLLAGAMVRFLPAKMMAAEGDWEALSPSPAPYKWIIVPDQAAERNRLEIATPMLGSIWESHSLTGRVSGLRTIARDRQPQMLPVFYGFRAMYVTAIAMFALCTVSLWPRWRGRLFTSRWFLRALVAMTPSGVIATIGGWYTAETGRQPWVIYGLLRTRDAVSPVPASAFVGSFIAFVLVYAVFLGGYLVFTLRHIRRGPLTVEAPRQATSDVAGSLKRALVPVGVPSSTLQP